MLYALGFALGVCSAIVGHEMGMSFVGRSAFAILLLIFLCAIRRQP